MLVPGRTDTKWYQGARFDVKCEYRGRTKFRGAKHSAPFPSHFLYWGSNVVQFIEAFQPHGRIYLP